MNDLLLLKPVLKEKVWGGKKLKNTFGYEIPSEHTGECWGISGHKHGTNEIINGPYKGMTLRELWKEHRELFAHEAGEEFPLLVKFIDAKDDLSVQVHPDDHYAEQHEGYTYGKTECWYIVDAVPGSEIVLGHTAATRDELASLVNQKNWEELFIHVPVKKGDFIYVPSGTVHAIGKGIVILEIQQSSDITYRFYDYDRPGQDGNMRELHLEESIACTAIPHQVHEPKRITWNDNNASFEQLIKEDYFTVTKLTLSGESNKYIGMNDHFLLMTVLEGTLLAVTEDGTHTITKGDHFIIPATVMQYELIGEGTIIVSKVNKE